MNKLSNLRIEVSEEIFENYKFFQINEKNEKTKYIIFEKRWRSLYKEENIQVNTEKTYYMLTSSLFDYKEVRKFEDSIFDNTRYYIMEYL